MIELSGFFLEKLTRQIGFKERWIGLMMTCIKSITYSILVNGEPRGMIHPTLPSFSFYYAQKDCTTSSSRLPDLVILKDSLSIQKALNLLICFWQMTAFYFAGQPHIEVFIRNFW